MGDSLKNHDQQDRLTTRDVVIGLAQAVALGVAMVAFFKVVDDPYTVDVVLSVVGVVVGVIAVLFRRSLTRQSRGVRRLFGYKGTDR
jgi:hypothetical protein